MERRSIGIIGGGAFGRAIASLFDGTNQPYRMVDIDEVLTTAQDVVVLAVPVAHLREALGANRDAFESETIVVGCGKGIERETNLLPHQIYQETIGKGTYVALSGPSFAKEISEQVPTVVDIACADFASAKEIQTLLQTSYFKVEIHDSVMEIELAGALKNVYAIAAGFVAGAGGGANTHAHLQVVALREYQQIARALVGNIDVVRPSIVGDLHLTTSSTMSRNYRFGFGQAVGDPQQTETVEGCNTIGPLCTLAKKHGVTLPLAGSVYAIMTEGKAARSSVFAALGF